MVGKYGITLAEYQQLSFRDRRHWHDAVEAVIQAMYGAESLTPEE